MEQLERIPWRENPDAVESGFDFYLQLLERRLRGDDVSLVQGLRQFYSQDLGIDLRETQARGLMHRTSSVFIDYVHQVLGDDFVPNVEHWADQGLETFLAWRGRFLEARDIQPVDLDQEITELLEQRVSERGHRTERRERVQSRIIRDTALGRFLKSLYDSQCQVCGYSFQLPVGTLYAECHHVRPLGQPHSGIDTHTNMVVLCPNHHAMMDYAVIAIHPEDLRIRGIREDLPEHDQPLHALRHPLDRDSLEYAFTRLFHSSN